MKKSTPTQFALRVIIYCFALLLIAFGVAISVNSNLGVSPVNSLPYVVSQIIQVPMGTCVTVIFCFYILLQVIILRKEFHPVQLLQIVFSTIFGYFVDFAKWVVGDFAIPTYFGQLTMLAASIVLIALGVLLYMDVQLVPMPMEGLSATIAKKLGNSRSCNGSNPMKHFFAYYICKHRAKRGTQNQRIPHRKGKTIRCYI